MTIPFDLIPSIKKRVRDKTARRAVYKALVEALRAQDLDVESLFGQDPLFDEACNGQYL